MPPAVTKRALAALKDVLDQRDAGSSRALRLTAGADRKLAFVLDTPRQDDVKVGLDGATVMIIEPRLDGELDGRTLDLRETPDGPLWTLTKPRPEGRSEESCSK